MLGKTYEEVAHNDLNNEINKLIFKMSELHLEHKLSIAVSYAEYFQQKVRTFKDIDKQFQLIIQSYKSHTGDPRRVEIYMKTYKVHTECQIVTVSNLDFIERIGFEEENFFKPSRNAVVKTTTNQTAAANIKSTTWNGDHFCDFVLKDDCSDNRFKMVGYGMINVDETPAEIVKLGNMKDASKLLKSLIKVDANEIVKSPINKVPSLRISIARSGISIIKATKNVEPTSIVHVPKSDKTMVSSSSHSSVGNGNSINIVEASKIEETGAVMNATTRGTIERSPNIDKSNTAKPPAMQEPVASGSGGASRSQTDVVSTQSNTKNVENSYNNIPPVKFPLRLRMKRYLAMMTGTHSLHDNDSNNDGVETKRQRNDW